MTETSRNHQELVNSIREIKLKIDKLDLLKTDARREEQELITICQDACALYSLDSDNTPRGVLSDLYEIIGRVFVENAT